VAVKILLVIFAILFQSVLSNSDVIEMTRAGLSPDTIVAKIKASKTAFDTSPTALTDLKSKGVAETVLLAMISPNNAPTETAHSDAREIATKALRRLANAVEIGVSYSNYGPLVAETKTELDTAFATGVSDSFKTSALKALAEYQFAAEVWNAHWRSDTVYGSYKDIAVNRYGVQKRGWLKVVWRDEFLRAIWREARLHYQSALNPGGGVYQSERDLTPTGMLRGLWLIQTVIDGSTVTWRLRVTDGLKTLGELYKEGEKQNSTIQGIAITAGNKFKIRTALRDGKTIGPTLEGVISGNEIKGNITIQEGDVTMVVDFAGARQP
jgi:hypothetical protein